MNSEISWDGHKPKLKRSTSLLYEFDSSVLERQKLWKRQKSFLYSLPVIPNILDTVQFTFSPGKTPNVASPVRALWWSHVAVVFMQSHKVGVLSKGQLKRYGDQWLVAEVGIWSHKIPKSKSLFNWRLHRKNTKNMKSPIKEAGKESDFNEMSKIKVVDANLIPP